MKILIIIPKYSANIKKDFTYSFPLGLAYISSTLKSAGYNVDCLNLNHYNGTIDELITHRLDSKKYDLVCTGGNALIYKILEQIINSIRCHKSNPIIILGGPIITSEPELMIKSLKPDFGVIGEGEKTILELLKNLDNPKKLRQTKGVTFIEENNVRINPKREPIEDIDLLPLPDLDNLGFKEYLDNIHCNTNYFENFFDFPRTYPLLGSRGCPFNCTFCWHPEKYRARNIKSIIEELRYAIEKYKINNILIYDDCFSANKERLYDFCINMKELSKEFPWKIRWHCQLLVNTVDKEMLQLMKNSGCITISYGFESFSPIILKSMHKPITPKQMHFAFKETFNANIGVLANFIFGDIEETKSTAKETLDYWKKHSRNQISLGFIKPYPGSIIYSSCIKRQIIKDKLEYIKNLNPEDILNMSERLSKSDFQKLSKEIWKLSFKFKKEGKHSLIKFKNNIYSINVICPFCKSIQEYKNCLIENKFNYHFSLNCRICKLRFSIASPIQNFLHKNYHLNKYATLLYDNLNKKKFFSFIIN